MDGHPLLRFSRMILIALAAATLTGQILEVERAGQIPAISMALRGSRVVSVTSGGAAEAIGVKPGDWIIRIGSREVTPSQDALSLHKELRAGQTTRLVVLRGGLALEMPYRPRVPTGIEILWRLALAGVGIMTLLIGMLIFLKKPRPLTLIFAAICFSMGYLIHLPFVPPTSGMFLLRRILLETVTPLLPPLLVHLFLLFPLRHPWIEEHRHRLALLYLPSLALLAASFSSQASLPPRELETSWMPPLIAAGATLIWTLGIIAAISLFVRAYRHARTGPSRQKVRVILWGTILGTFPIVVLVILQQIQPGLQFPGDRLAVISMILIPLSFGYAIVRHGVFDLTLIVRRSFAWSSLGMFLVVVYFSFQMGLRALFPDFAQASPLWVSFLSLLAVGLFLAPAQRGLSMLLAGQGGLYRRDKQDLLYEFGRSLRGLLQQDHLVRAVSESIGEAIGAKRVAYFEMTSNGTLIAVYLYGLPKEQLCVHRLSPALSLQLARVQGPIDRGDLDTELPFGYLSPPDQDVLDTLDVELLIPLRTGGKLKGMLFLGEPAYGEPFTATDSRLAETISAEASIALENSILHERVMEEERLKREVDVARDLQERLLPAHLPQVESLEIMGFSIPCYGVGGDYYDCFRSHWGDLLLAIGDASGKGVPGAILMANLQGLVKVEGMRDEPPWRIVERINRRLCEMQKPERFITFCLARIDPLTGALAYCNAGHPSMLLARTDGTIEELAVGGLPLGIRTQASYEGGETVMRSGDVLLLYTDGITERQRGGGDGELFGRQRLHELVRNGRRLSAQALKESILGEVREFAPTPLDDDTTLLLIKML